MYVSEPRGSILLPQGTVSTEMVLKLYCIKVSNPIANLCAVVVVWKGVTLAGFNQSDVLNTAYLTLPYDSAEAPVTTEIDVGRFSEFPEEYMLLARFTDGTLQDMTTALGAGKISLNMIFNSKY